MVRTDEANWEERLAHFGPLSVGAHKPNGKACVMEAVAFVAGEAWSDHPECACPVISSFLRAWNDGLPDDERDALLRPLIPRLIGTRGFAALETRRSLMAADWLVRVHTPAWLRLAKLNAAAAALEALPEITDVAQIPSIRGRIEVARRDADAAWAATWDAAWDGARVAAWDATWAAGGDAAWDATWDGARAATWAAAEAAARAAAWDATWDGARAATWAALASTRIELQQSALALVNRMIDAREP